ncbi:hypothetical protein HK102_004514 [Quaeritorhiza haematococci]|nr:hypothetical protein HK102_004514 [Quaeritorhiza haematococci]
MRFLDYRVETIRPLNDTRAVELGANFISESLIFSVAVATILGETWRSHRATKKTREDVYELIAALQVDTTDLRNMAHDMDAKIERSVELAKQNSKEETSVIRGDVETLREDVKALGSTMEELQRQNAKIVEKIGEVTRSLAVSRLKAAG